MRDCRFIRSDSHNLKYMGIKGLAAIVKDFPQYASDHQMAVIDCLEDPDETLKRKTVSPSNSSSFFCSASSSSTSSCSSSSSFSFSSSL